MALNASTKNLVGAAVLSVFAAFNTHAEAIHPILDTSTGATAYSGYFIQALDGAIGAQTGEYLGRGAVVDLEAALKQPSAKPRVVYFPQDATVNEPRVVMGISPNATDPVYACVEGAGHFNKWEIMNNGSVVPNNDTLQVVQGRTPCQSWIISAMQGKTQPVAQAPIPVKAQGELQGAARK